MKPTQQEIDGSLELVKRYSKLPANILPEIVAMHLADAYLFEKQKNDESIEDALDVLYKEARALVVLLERQYAELKEHFANTTYPCCLDMLARHETERQKLEGNK